MKVFQTANSVRVVSPVVVVVISVVAASPRTRLHPPKVYPARVVVVVLESDSVETRKESDEIRVEVSVAGTEVAKVLPSKTIVGLAAVVALADEEIAVRPARVRRVVSKIAIVLFDTEDPAELRTADMSFPSIMRFMMPKLTLDL
jgi:hypothetical protein